MNSSSSLTARNESEDTVGFAVQSDVQTSGYRPAASGVETGNKMISCTEEDSGFQSVMDQDELQYINA